MIPSDRPARPRRRPGHAERRPCWRQLLPLALSRLAEQYTGGEFVFTTIGEAAPAAAGRCADGRAERALRGHRGARPAPVAASRSSAPCWPATPLPTWSASWPSGWMTSASIGDVALICWAAAEAGHSELPHALARLGQLDRRAGRAGRGVRAWVVSALVAAREPGRTWKSTLAVARQRLLAAPGRRALPARHRRPVPWYRAHVGSFADQVYPIQALARLHDSAADPEALAAANAVAKVICDAQGPAGQWWWHYDSRTGGVVEGYPVYTVHQHAMAPMALLDLADAGGDAHLAEICRGLRWLAAPPEARPCTAQLVLDDPPITWRKVARADHRKLVRGVRAGGHPAASTHPARSPGPDLPAGDRGPRVPALRAGLAAADLAVLSQPRGTNERRRGRLDPAQPVRPVHRRGDHEPGGGALPGRDRPRRAAVHRRGQRGQDRFDAAEPGAARGGGRVRHDPGRRAVGGVGQPAARASRCRSGWPASTCSRELLAEAERSGDRVYFLGATPGGAGQGGDRGRPAVPRASGGRGA